MLITSPVAFGEDAMDDFQWNAFISQSAIYTSDNDLFSRSDDRVSLDLWEAGILFTKGLADQLDFSAQLLGRKVSEYSDEDIRIDYAFLNYQLAQSQNSTFGIRVGRIRSSYGLYNETRDIPHTRTGILMPQSVYFDKTRNTFFSADGAEFYGFHDIGDNRLAYQVFLGRPFADEEEAQESQLPVSDLTGQHGLLAKISYGADFDGFKVAFTYFHPQYEFDIEPGLIDSDEEFYTESMLTSLEYNQFNWSLTAEYLRLKFKVLGVEVNEKPVSQLFFKPLYGEAFYLQGLYRFNSHWETYVRYDQSEDRYWATYNSGSFFRDSNIGLTFRPNAHWLIRTEAHYIEGSSNLANRDNAAPHTKYWHAAMLQIAYQW